MSEFVHGRMDVAAHMGTYQQFCRILKWSTIGIIAILVLMAIFLV